MKKALAIVIFVAISGCTQGFQTIEAPNWEKGDQFVWAINSEASGSATFQEPGSPPISIVLPPTEVISGEQTLTVLDKLNNSFEWYPVLAENVLTFSAFDETETEDDSGVFAMRASDLAPGGITVLEPFQLLPGPFGEGIPFPITEAFVLQQPLDPEFPEVGSIVLEASEQKDIKTPAGTFTSQGLTWRLDLDESIIEDGLREEGATEASISIDASGSIWYSEEAQNIVKSDIVVSVNVRITMQEGGEEFSANVNGRFTADFSLQQSGNAAVAALESYFEDQSQLIDPVIDIEDTTEEKLPTAITLTSDRINTATETATATLEGPGGEVPAVFFLIDLNGNVIDISPQTTSWELPTHVLGIHEVFASPDDAYLIPDPKAIAMGFEGDIIPDCPELLTPLDDTCEATIATLGPGIASMQSTVSGIGILNVSISGPSTGGNEGLFAGDARIDNPLPGTYSITQSGTGTVDAATLAITPESLGSIQGTSAQLSPQPTLPPQLESLRVHLTQWLPGPLPGPLGLLGSEIQLPLLGA